MNHPPDPSENSSTPTILDKRQIAHQFSRAAASYDSVSQLQRKMVDVLLKRINSSSKVMPGWNIIDLGCGTGYALDQISKKWPVAGWGIDLAAGMIEQATVRLRDRVNLNLKIADLEDTGLPDESAEMIFCSSALQWCRSELALAEMQRLLKPAGELLLATFGPATMAPLRAAWQEIGETSAPVHQFESAAQLLANLSEDDWTDIRWETQAEVVRYDTVKSLLLGIKQLGATHADRSRKRGLLGKQKYQALCRQIETKMRLGDYLELPFEIFYLSAKRTERPQ